MNVAYSGSGALGVFLVNGVPQFGFPPQPAMIGDWPFLVSSYITSQTSSGSNAQGATHLTLKHTYVSQDPARVGSFTTEDRAVCAPSGNDPAVCRVNDVLRIVEGDGVFTNAGGSLRNHGLIYFAPTPQYPMGYLTYNVRGRICGDGL
jgi:hypothetical protein